MNHELPRRPSFLEQIYLKLQAKEQVSEASLIDLTHLA